MLKIEKIKEEIKNFDTDVTADEIFSCWLYRITTNPIVVVCFCIEIDHGKTNFLGITVANL